MKNVKRLENLFNLAKDLKPASQNHVRMMAGIYVKNDLIAVGYAQDRSHPFAAKYSKLPAKDGCFDKNKSTVSLHAETHAILNAIKTHENLKDMNATIYVARAKKNKQFGNWIWGSSRPCEGCNRAIRDYNLNVVFMEDEAIYMEKRVTHWTK